MPRVSQPGSYSLSHTRPSVLIHKDSEFFDSLATLSHILSNSTLGTEKFLRDFLVSDYLAEK